MCLTESCRSQAALGDYQSSVSKRFAVKPFIALFYVKALVYTKDRIYTKALICAKALAWSLSALLAVLLSGQAVADSVPAATERVVGSNQASSASQQRIDGLDEKAQEVMQEFMANERQSDLIEAYNRQLAKLVRSQQSELADLQVQIDSIEATEQAILPMLNDMVEELAIFIESDLPMLEDEREQRLQKLRLTLDRADVSVGEKYRQVLQAYEIEMEYGKTVESYAGVVDRNGQDVHVNFLRVGRMALYYQSRDGRQSALWLPEAQRWHVLNDTQNQQISEAMLMAKQLKVPALMSLPVPHQIVSEGA